MEVGDKFIVEIDSKIKNGTSYGYGLKDLPVIISEKELDNIPKYDYGSQERIVRKSTLDTINKVFAIAPNKGFFDGENPETIIYDYSYDEIVEELKIYREYLMGLYKQYYSGWLTLTDRIGRVTKLDGVPQAKVHCTSGKTIVDVLGTDENRAKMRKIYAGARYVLDGAGTSCDTWKKYAGYEEREKCDPFDTDIYRLIFLEESCGEDAIKKEIERINKMPF